METGGDGYSVDINPPASLTIVNDTCHGITLHYGATCQFSVEANNVAIPMPDSSNHYQPEKMSVTIEAVNTTTGQKLTKTIPVSLLSAPAITQVSPATGGNFAVTLMGKNAYHTANISGEDNRSTWIVPRQVPGTSIIYYEGFIYPFNVPLINTYNADQTYTPLAMAMRCGNSLVYFVAQQKLGGSLVSTHDGYNVTVKYHPLIADGVTSGLGEPGQVLDGLLTLLEQGQAPITQHTQVNAHVSTWSGPENIDRLRELITTYTTPDNSTIMSILDQISGAPFIDPDNVGVDKIITIHSLLNTASADTLRQALDAGDQPIDLLDPNIDLTSIPADEQTFIAAVKLYANEVAKACYVQTS